jgi:dTDP-glucose 4,6-dehydratase
MRTVLVTGGAGFIGSCFVRRSLAHDAVRLINLDRLSYASSLESLEPVKHNPRHVFVKGDIGDRALVSQLLRTYDVAAVVNFAAESHVDRSIDGPREFLTTNVVGAFDLLLAVCDYWEQLPSKRRDAFRFLQVSTDEVYGSLGDSGKFIETSRYAPDSPYAASKAAADHFVRAFGRTYGLPVLITNCSNNYGPYQFPEKLIPRMILNALEGKPLPVYGDGQNIRDWLYVEDHCDAVQRVLDSGQPGQTYNIGGGCELTNLQLVQTICRLLDRRDPALPHRSCESLITFVPDRPGHDRRYAIDFSKIQQELNWRPAVSLSEGLNRTVRWYVENLAWAQRAEAEEARRARLGVRGMASDAML